MLQWGVIIDPESLEKEPTLSPGHFRRSSIIVIVTSVFLLVLLLLILTASDARADDPYGSGWISEVDVVGGTNLDEYEPGVAPGPNGKLWLSTIYEYRVMGDSGGMPVPISKWGLRVLSSLDGGRHWYEEFQLVGEENYAHPVIDVASDGTVLVMVYCDRDLLALVYSEGEVTTKVLATGAGFIYPSLTIDASDQAYCTFAGFSFLENQDIYFTTAQYPYAYWSTPKILVGGYDSYRNENPSISVDTTGHVYIAYEHSINDINPDIYVIDSPDKGVNWRPEPGIAVSTNEKQEGSVTIAIFKSDVLMVAWEQRFSDTDYDVRCSISWDHGQSFSSYPGFITTGRETNPHFDTHVRSEDGLVKMVLQIEGLAHYVWTNPDLTPYFWSTPALICDEPLSAGNPGLAITTYYFENTHHSIWGWTAHVLAAFSLTGNNIFTSTDHYILTGGGFSPNTTDVGQPVYFGAYSWYGAGSINYHWVFGDGAEIYTPYPSHVYSTPGNYYAFVIATDSLGYSDYWDKYPAVINPWPEVMGSATPLELDVGMPVQFSCAVTGGTPPLSFAWEFDDGGTSTEQNPSHVFAIPGDYDGTLIVTDQVGQHGWWASQDIHVNPLPSFSYTQSANDINIYMEVSFTAQAIDGTKPYSYLWEFGDGQISFLNNVSHIYSQVGMFLPKCTMTDGAGYSLVAEMGWVMVHQSATLTVFAQPTQGIVPLNINYTCFPTGGIPPYTFEWYFGDGGFSDEQNPNHTYSEPGEYHAIMVLMDSTQATTTTVEGPLIMALEEMVVEGNASKTLVDTGQDIFFNCSVSGGLPPYQANWSFGDGETVYGFNAVHGYSLNGTFHVFATVNDSASPSNVRYLSLPPIQVNLLPLMLTGPNRTEVDVGLLVSFYCQPLYGTSPYYYIWDFGDGNGSEMQQPEHAWSSPGAYMVTMMLIDSTGAEAPWPGSLITVHPWPSASLGDVPSMGVAPFMINLTCTVQGGTPPFRHYWDFGDLSGWDKASVSHLYVNPGEYSVTVWVKDECDVSVSSSPFNLTVMEALRIANASVTPTTIDLGQSIAFGCTIEGGLPPYTLNWSFGDGNWSNSRLGSHLFASVGTFNVSLEVRDAFMSLTKSLIAQVTVNPPLSMEVEQSSTHGGVPLTVEFSCTVIGGTPPFSFEWTLGEGSTNHSEDTIHVYRSLGHFSPTLVVTDATNATSSWSGEEIEAVLPEDFLVECESNPLSGYAPLLVHFNVNVTGADPSYEFKWGFGDGGLSSEPTCMHTYLAPGNYTVTFEIIDPMVPVTIFTWTGGPVRVSPVPTSLTVEASANVSEGLSPLSVQFTCAPQGNIPPYEYHWDFGDGGTSGEREPQHTYLSPGTYEVELNVTGAYPDGGNFTWQTTIVVSEAPGQDDQTDWLLPSAIAIVVVLAIAAAALLYFRRRK